MENDKYEEVEELENEEKLYDGTGFDEEEIEEEELEEEENEVKYRTQEDFDRAFRRRFERERKKLAKQMGFETFDEAAEFASAGRAVSSASGLTPSQVRQKLQQQASQQQQQAGTVQGPAGDDVKQEIAEIKGILADERVEKVRNIQIAEAKKEFGKLYDQYEEDILDKAEDADLTIVDAAAIVLRPKLRQHVEEQNTKRKQVQRKRRLESDAGKPTKSVDYDSALTSKEKEIAAKMGVSLEKYYARRQQREQSMENR